MGTTYQQAIIPIADPNTFGAVRDAISGSFSAPRVSDFLRALDRSSVRIRDFETVLSKGLLGPETSAQYARLPDGDQGQIREFYLASLEKIDPDLRNRFFKLYAYY